MGASELTGRLSAAVARMEQVLDGLKMASPEALDGCAGLVEQSCLELALGAGDSAFGGQAALPAALRLRSQIRQARGLLENVYRFHTGWGQWLGARTGGYMADGRAAPVVSGTRMSWRG